MSKYLYTKYLYPKLPHDELIKHPDEEVDFAFNDGNKKRDGKFLTMRGFYVFWNKKSMVTSLKPEINFSQLI